VRSWFGSEHHVQIYGIWELQTGADGSAYSIAALNLVAEAFFMEGSKTIGKRCHMRT
jgi:hypothetical protein